MQSKCITLLICFAEQQNRLMEQFRGIKYAGIKPWWPYFRQALVLFLSSFSIILLTSQVTGLERISGTYLGQTPPGNSPELFAEGIIPADLHSVPVFSPDGKRIYYKAMDNKGIMVLREKKNGWSNPMPLFVNDEVENSDDPCLDPSGDKLYFTSYSKENNREYIYYCDQKNSTKCNPEKPGGSLNSLDLHWQFTIAENRNIYFSSNGNLFCSVFRNGAYEEPYKLNTLINTEHSECTPYISPDENMLIFSRSNSVKPDLFVSYKGDDGNWQEPKVLGPPVNSEHHEMCPMITPDGKYLFFISSRGGLFSAYWVDVSVVSLGFGV